MFEVYRRIENTVLGTALTLRDAVLAMTDAIRAGEVSSNLDIRKAVR